MQLPVPLRLGRAAWEPRGGSAWKSVRLDLVARGRIELPACTTRRGTPLKPRPTWVNACTARLFPASGVPREGADVVRRFACATGVSRRCATSTTFF